MGYFLPQKVVLRYSDGGLNRLELDFVSFS